MTEYPTLQTLRIDPHPIAWTLESVVGDYLLDPAPGIYVKGRYAPAMLPGEIYHQRATHGGDLERVVVTNIDEIDPSQPVVDIDGNVVISQTAARYLSTTPWLPARGVEIVKRVIEQTLLPYGDQRPKRRVIEADQLFEDMIKPEFRADGDIINQILGIVSPLRGQVKDFAGAELWIVHFIIHNNFSLDIEKSVDFRIAEFHRLSKTRYA